MPIQYHYVQCRGVPRVQEFQQKEIEKMLGINIIAPSRTELATPVVLVPKMDALLWVCVYYHKINSATVPDSYPVCRMEDFIDSFGNATIFRLCTPTMTTGK